MDGTTQLLEADRRYLVHPPCTIRLIIASRWWWSRGKGAIICANAEGRE